MKRLLCGILLLTLVWNCTACGGSPDAQTYTPPSASSPAPAQPSTLGALAEDLPERVLVTEDRSRTPVTVDDAALEQFVAFLDGLEVPYPHPEFFQLEPLYAQRMAERETVTVHQNRQPILQDSKIDQSLLFSVVQENNAAYFADEDRNYMHTPMEHDQDIRDVIGLLSQSLEYDLPKLSQAEQDRLNCLLGDLKIVEASGLSLAAVVLETHVLYVNPPMIDVGELSSGNENAYRNTLYHEAKHLLQSDCPCYDDAAYRQTGTMRLPVDADPLDPFRSFWLLEGSAEKAASIQTGDAPMSYGNLVGYVESLDLAALLSPQAADGRSVEDCTLRRDTAGLLSLLGGGGQTRSVQVLQMLWGMEIVQEYANQMQEDLGLSDDTFLDLRMELKTDCCLEIARCFYRNLALALQDAQGVTLEDLFCLMTIFAGDFYYHTENVAVDMAREPLELLHQMEFQFLTAVTAGQGTTPEALETAWQTYALWQNSEGAALNASLSWLDGTKTDYLTARAASDTMYYLPPAGALLNAAS